MAMEKETLRVQPLSERLLAKGNCASLTLPAQYVQSEGQRVPAVSGSVPVIDVSLLHGTAEERKETVNRIGAACREWGIFFAVNHGISGELIQELRTVGEAFFQLPQAEKEAYTARRVPDKPIAEGYAISAQGYGIGSNTDKTPKLGWVDYYFHLLAPPSQVNHAVWPAHHPRYREITEKYNEGLTPVAKALMEAMDEHLGLNPGSLAKAVGGMDEMDVLIKLSYYPPCPRPDLVFGVAPHTDLSALTLLLSNGVPGLNVCRSDGVWVAVEGAGVPDGALIVHIGDKLKIASAGAFCNVLHRSTVESDRVRMSWPVFYMPPLDAVVEPVPELRGQSSLSPEFTPLPYREFLRLKFSNKNTGV